MGTARNEAGIDRAAARAHARACAGTRRLPRPEAARATRGRLTRGVPFGLLAALLVGCSSAPRDWEALRGETAVRDQIYEQTIRYVTTHYIRSARVPEPAAWCLAVGRRSDQALNLPRRNPDETWIPSRRLLSRLNDVEPTVVSVSDCSWNSEVEEIYLPTESAAILLQVDEPDFDSPDVASVRVLTRESKAYAFSYRCDIVRDEPSWRIVRCV